MSSHQKQNRPTPRQLSAEAQRRTMTERRQKFTQRIRKQKKSDWLAQKRGVPAGTDTLGTFSNVDVSQLIASFLQQQPTSHQSLEALYLSLQAASMSPTPWTLDDPIRLEQAKHFVQRLGEVLHQCQISQNTSMAVMTLKILVQLTAMNSSSKNSFSEGASYDYYGRKTQGWCDLIAEEGSIAQSFSGLLTLPQPLPEPLPGDLLEIWKETCWLIGNLAQDLPQTCPTLKRDTPLLTTLLHTLRYTSSNLPVVQAASWAVLNILRGDPSSSAYDYCNPQQPNSLTLPLFHRLLSLEGDMPPEKDIPVQTAWILVQLSQKEDDLVDYLLQAEQGIDLAQALLDQLYRIGQRAHEQQQQQAPNQHTNYFHHPFIEPCLELFGLWATVANGKHVPRLLFATSQRSLLNFISQLITWGHQGLLQVNDYLQALWVAGCLLCDAGAQNHPSTLLAAPVLVPLLTMGLQEHTQQSSKTFSLECKREGILALWNAITAPPSDDQMEASQTSLFQEDGLLSLLQFILATTAANAAGGKSSEYLVMMALKNLLLCQDVDTMLAAMHVLNAILRNIPSSRVLFMECDGDEALEEVCDLPLGNDNASTEAADLAADLIDEFFDSSRPTDEDQFADPILQPAQESGSFVFGINADAPTVLMSNSDQADQQQTGDFAISTDLPVFSAADNSDPSAPGMGHGRGRGRGKTLPA